MLNIKDLAINLRDDDRFILKDFDFVLNDRDKVGLIGEEGNGKSLLLKAIVNRKEIESFCDISGDIFKNNDIIAYLPQSLDKKYYKYTTNEYFYEKADLNLLDYNNLYKYISEFDLPEDILSDKIKMKNLSGGEKIKFMLLIEMLKSPTIFLFDEPSNDLDYDSLIWLENFMKELGIPLIFVSHDTKLLSNIANRIIHLEQVKRRTEAKHTISNNSYDDYVKKRENFIETETNKANKDKEEFDKKLEKYKKVHDSVEHNLRSTKNDVEGRLLKEKMHTVKSIGRRLEKEEANLTEKPDYEEAIDIFFDEDIKVANGKQVLDYKLDELKIGDKILAKNIDLKVIGPEKICIVGKNGAGKTTLLKKIKSECQALNLKIGYMPQNYFEFEKDDINAIEYLADSFIKDNQTKASNLLGSLNFKREEMFRNIADLSGGQKAKLFFAKMNLDKAEVLILDEPTRNLSPLSKPEIIGALKYYKGAIIAVSHDREFIDQVFDKIYNLTCQGLK
ncbi:MAG: ATP-binding cassette domain-containing protein [Anaerococcus sp.]|uniref:ATP-binding cassette domain-containing protein n=1 Tax=Anaerococcus sp. TaxID=1872515 RepID=UPI00290A1355|nr:ATP-binding cassette domain-containing protein [Anaerococcus sp.]MDU4025052.1 ATP-binding cassette domain-containing protein [Anaerococcus sp.]